MEIQFSNRKLQKIFGSEKELQRKYGMKARKIMMRMQVLKHARTLAEVPYLPPDRRHELKGELKGTFAVDITGNERLIFKPLGNPPRREDGGIDLSRVDGVEILDVGDYH
jgi:proteic killer suppression protein